MEVFEFGRMTVGGRIDRFVRPRSIDFSSIAHTHPRERLSTHPAPNPASFMIPIPRSPPAPRVFSDTFVLPKIPQEWRE